MNTMVSVASLATAAAVASPIGSDAPISIDPIFAAIEAHRTAYAEYLRELGDGTDEETNESLEITDRAANALLATEPMTISGAAALLAYFSEQTIQDETYFPDTAGEDETVPFAAALTGLASRSLCRHASFSGGASVGPASPIVPSIAHDKTDPIFAAIEAHQEAAAAHGRCVGHRNELEEVLLADKRRSLDRRDMIVKTDDTRFIEAAKAVSDARDKMFDLAAALIETPTTAGGVVALLKYVSETHGGDDDWMFPEYVSGDDDEDEGEGEPYQLAVMRHASEALQRMTTA